MAVSSDQQAIVRMSTQFADDVRIYQAPEPGDSIRVPEIWEELCSIAVCERNIPFQSTPEPIVEILVDALTTTVVNRDIKIWFLCESPVEWSEVLDRVSI